MDRRSCRIRADRSISPEEQQHHPARLSNPESAQSKKGLIRFGKSSLERDLERAIRKWWFEKTLPAKIDAEVRNWHASQPANTASPVFREEPLDPELQTGDSQKLGGPMSIHAPWRRD